MRILAAFSDSENYFRPLKTYLNTFVAQNRISGIDHVRYTRLFDEAAELLLGNVGRAALRPRGGGVNAAFTEAVFVGLMRKLELNRGYSDYAAVGRAVRELVDDGEMMEATATSTAEYEVFQRRLRIAADAFSAL